MGFSLSIAHLCREGLGALRFLLFLLFRRSLLLAILNVKSSPGGRPGTSQALLLTLLLAMLIFPPLFLGEEGLG